MCADTNTFPKGPPDTTCIENNPFAEFDETIPELCDTIDNNCNGEVDEGCECFSDSFKRCWDNDYPIELHTTTNTDFGRLKGECDYGRQVCRKFTTGGSEWGAWEDGPDQVGGTDDDVWVGGLCLGVIVPQTEVCDGKDNNCDGSVDESLKRSCWNGPRKPDGTPMDHVVFYDPSENFSLCKMGIQTCENSRWSACLYEVLPSEEVCDGADNNCNGNIDEGAQGVGAECGMTEAGICEYGHYQCVYDGTKADLKCDGAILPEIEVCDNLDNNCDGTIDELLLKPCETICGSGFEVCSRGDWVDCSAPEPEPELCDAVDNDCDGLIDEGLDCSCPAEMVGSLLPCRNNPLLVCGSGYMQCECETPECLATYYSECQALCAFFPEMQEECIPENGIPEPEVCNNWDDDCDEEVDEDLFRGCYTGPPGTLNVGLCEEGRQICKRGRWGADVEDVFVDNLCIEQTTPVEEVCNRLDDDCDGETDEDLNSHEKVDMVFIIDRSGSMCSTINALRSGIQPYVLDFIDMPHKFAIINVPGAQLGARNPDVLIDFVDAATFQQALNGINCDLGSIEPQYDAVYHVARNDYGLSFRDDAYPMMIVFTDEIAQSAEGLDAATVRGTLSPCLVGDCGADDVFEVYAVVPRAFHNEWCEPANIARSCYNLYNGISSAEIRSYLDDIFSDICR
tara:strand:- start:6716 stop:8755 length:2040 start_codon:yes stop_codon:yes gene_type:complete